jgi:hypothetical protein
MKSRQCNNSWDNVQQLMKMRQIVARSWNRITSVRKELEQLIKWKQAVNYTGLKTEDINLDSSPSIQV